MKTKHDELILLLQTLLEKAEFLGHSTNALEYGICYDQVRPVIKSIEKYMFTHPEIPFSDENRNLLSPDQAYDKFPVSLKNAAFLLQRAVISREDDNSGKVDAGRDNTKTDNRNSPTAENISGTIQALQLLKLSQQDYWKAYAALGKEGKLSEKQQDYSDYVKPSLDIAKACFEDFQLYYYIQHYGTGQLKTVKSINLLLDGQGVSEDTAIDKLIKELEAVEQHIVSKRINPPAGVNGAENSQNYSAFLLDIAGQVNSLIEQNRGRFIQQVKEFEDRFYHWQVEFRKAYQDAKDKPYLRYNENEHKSRYIPAEYIFYDTRILI